MAVDTDEVFMTTKLAGKSTFFLPFNKGHNHGQGNPPNPNGHKTAYLWEEVFSRESLANIIEHFVRLDGTAKDQLVKRTLFFPRYHQLDVVRRLISDALCPWCRTDLLDPTFSGVREIKLDYLGGISANRDLYEGRRKAFV